MGADPSALANYIIALLERDQPAEESKQSCLEKLEEFLDKETKSFVDKLFQFMATTSEKADTAKDGEEKEEGNDSDGDRRRHRRKSRRKSASKSKSRSRSGSGSRDRKDRKRRHDHRDKKSKHGSRH